MCADLFLVDLQSAHITLPFQLSSDDTQAYSAINMIIWDLSMTTRLRFGLYPL